MDYKGQCCQPGNTPQISLQIQSNLLSKSQSTFCVETDMLDPNIYMEIWRLETSKKNLEKEVQSLKTYSPEFETQPQSYNHQETDAGIRTNMLMINRKQLRRQKQTSTFLLVMVKK